MPFFPKSTAKVIAYKALNRNYDETWPDWATELLIAGFETENLLMLAGIRKPFDYFEMVGLTSKALDDLNLDYSDQHNAVQNYLSYLIHLCFNNELKPVAVLTEARDIYLELDHEVSLQEFYFLYYAKTDLMEDEVQWYIADVDRSNIDDAIMDYFRTWISIHPLINYSCNNN